MENRDISPYDEQKRRELDADLRADPARPRSRGVNKLMAVMGNKPRPPGRAK